MMLNDIDIYSVDISKVLQSMLTDVYSVSLLYIQHSGAPPVFWLPDNFKRKHSQKADLSSAGHHSVTIITYDSQSHL